MTSETDLVEIAGEIRDHAEEMLIAADDEGFIQQYAPMWGYERGGDGSLVAVRYGNTGDVLGRYRVEIAVSEGVPDDK